MIKPLTRSRFDEIDRIHKEFYKDQFEFPDFITNFLCGYVSVDDNDKIVSVGGIRTIVELIAITDKNTSARQRRKSLLEILDVSSQVTRNYRHEQLHVFIQDSDNWEQILKKVGFKDCKGKPLVINL